MSSYPRDDFASWYVAKHNPTFSLRGVRHRKRAQLVYDEARRLFAVENGMSVSVWRAKWLRGELPDTGNNHFTAHESIMLRFDYEP